MNSQHTQPAPLALSLDDFAEGVIPKGRSSVIDPYAAQVAEAIEVRKLSYEQVAQWLKANGVQVTKQSVGKWWKSRKAEADARLAAAPSTPAINYGRRSSDVVQAPAAAPVSVEAVAPALPPAAKKSGGKLILKSAEKLPGHVSQAGEPDTEEARRQKVADAIKGAADDVAKQEKGVDVDSY